jgi:hypothetical protein
MAEIPNRIDRLSEDGEYPSFLSAEYANQIVDLYNALRNMTVVGGKVVWSDSKVVIRLDDDILKGINNTSTGSFGSGSITIDRGDVWQ